MASKKYFYNPETCTYEPVRRRKTNIFIGFLSFLVVSFLLAVILTAVFSFSYDTEREAELRVANNELEEHYRVLSSSLDEANQMMTVLNQRDHNLYNNIYETKGGKKELIGEGILPESFDELYRNGFQNKKAVKEFYSQVKLLQEQTNKSNKEIISLISLAINKSNSMKYIPTIQPIVNPGLNSLASGYGKRMNPFHHGIMDHEGVDFAAPKGSPIVSTAFGTVKYAKLSESDTGYGSRVDIDHGNGIITRYTHLDEIFVSVGDEVSRSMVIGTVGLSGGTIAPCVHYEVIRNGNKINPVNFFIQDLNENDYLTILELALRENQSLD